MTRTPAAARAGPCAALAAAAALALLAPACRAPWPVEPRAPRPSPLPALGIAAHRGAASTHPENTLAALREAVRLGAHQIEFDVRPTADGALVLMHDASVDRTTDGHGRVEDLTLAEIERLDAGGWKAPRFAGERVPTFEQALDVLPRDVWINVHVKGEPWVAERAAAVIVERDRVAQAILAVGEDGARAARRVAPDAWICLMDRGLTRGGYVAHATALRADFVQLTSWRGRPSPAEVERARGGGLRVNYCCESDPERLPELFAAGVEFPMLDDAAEAVRIAAALGIAPPRTLAAVRRPEPARGDGPGAGAPPAADDDAPTHADPAQEAR